MKVVVHFGGWLSRQFVASSSLSRAARTALQRHPRNPEICANLTRKPPARRNAQQGLPHCAGKPDATSLAERSWSILSYVTVYSRLFSENLCVVAVPLNSGSADVLVRILVQLTLDPAN